MENLSVWRVVGNPQEATTTTISIKATHMHIAEWYYMNKALEKGNIQPAPCTWLPKKEEHIFLHNGKR